MKRTIGKGIHVNQLLAIATLGTFSATPALAATYTWDDGGQYDSTDVTPSAPATLLSGDVLNISDGGYFSGGAFTVNAGATVDWTVGILGLANGAQISNSGLWNADSAAALSLYDAGYGGTFTNAAGGTLESTGAGELTVAASGSLNFVNSGGTISAASGASLLFSSGGTGQVSFTGDSTFAGSGSIIIGGAGADFTGTQTFNPGSNVNFSSGQYFSTGPSAATLSGNATWSGGQFYGGSWTLPLGDTLTVTTTPGGNTKYFNATTFTNNGAIDWNTSDEVLLANGSTVTNNGTFLITAATTLADGGYGGTFVNAGSLADTGGGTVNVNASGSLSFQNSSGGYITATNATDAIVFNAGGAGQVTFANNSYFTGAGSITIAGAGGIFTGAQNIASSTSFMFAAGSFEPGTGGATIAGNATWSGGQFYGGSWTLPLGDTLTVTTTPGGNTKYFNATTFTNNGAIDWNTSDEVLLANGSTVTNNGTFLITAATTLADGGYGGTFVNAGSLADTGGGTVNVNASGSLSFQNNSGGYITATNATDAIVFNAGSAGQVTFASNSYFTGAGSITVAGQGATFTGMQNIASTTALNLASGYFETGSTGATLSGPVTWSGGQFYGGTWTNAAGSILTALTTPGGNTKYFDATTFNNNGIINWNTTDTIYLANGALVTNNGTFNVAADASFADGGYGGTLVNNGLLAKTGGTGTTSVAPGGSFTGLVNNGVTVVDTGTIALGSTFTNPGTLAGIGTFTAGTLTNNGTIAPGQFNLGLQMTSPGTLNLVGNLTQGTGAKLLIGLISYQNPSNGLLNVTGSAALAGALDVNCMGSCTFTTTGNPIEVLATTTGITGSFANVVSTGFTGGASDFKFYTGTALGLNPDDGYIEAVQNVTAVPEPADYALALAGGGLLYALVRRRLRHDRARYGLELSAT